MTAVLGLGASMVLVMKVNGLWLVPSIVGYYGAVVSERCVNEEVNDKWVLL